MERAFVYCNVERVGLKLEIADIHLVPCAQTYGEWQVEDVDPPVKDLHSISSAVCSCLWRIFSMRTPEYFEAWVSKDRQPATSSTHIDVHDFLIAVLVHLSPGQH